jgi:hypothetical protein
MTAHRLSVLVRMARVWGPIVKKFAANSGLTGLASNKVRRTGTSLCHQAGGELENI